MVVNDKHFAIARKRMIKEQIMGRGIRDERVTGAMEKIPRHLFVDEALKDQAYIDAPLNIGEGQTISQPYIVALMTQALCLRGTEKVLEIGTGCGYQAVILSLLGGQVYTIERVKKLALKARQRFKALGLKNLVMRIGDGSLGWPEAAPFDGILYTCASPQIPENLLAQLKMGGRLVVPVFKEEGVQELLCVLKTEQGLEKQSLGLCRFVRLIGKYGYQA